MTSEREIADVAYHAADAVRKTMQAAHASGKHAPDAPGKPAEWRGQTSTHHALRAIAHLLYGLPVQPGKSLLWAYQAIEAVRAELGADPRAFRESMKADDGKHLLHAITRLAMAACVKAKDGAKLNQS